MRAEEIWYGDGWKPAAVRTLLTPLSWLYTLGWQSYLGMYRLGLKRPQEPHRPVLCVGNLVVGGSGKSPLVLHLARLLRNLGQDVVVSASGYGSPRAAGASVAPDGPLDPAEWGDEPAMLRWLQPDLPIVVGRRRVLAAQLVARSWPGSVMLMDDGFQHLPLHKHLTLLLDPDIPNSQTLPAGPYREPRVNRSRADLVLPGAFRVQRRSLRFVDPEDMSE
ncbi:MAG TPA: tetraacyldisaccharide 4'-kinase, partial [Fimbriimonadaceae bacterium]|nr:tetraacyldisaccharide 4'-kinase [Fimbriimonadaceae bacterium]